MNINLKKGDYFNYGEHYYVNFKYGSKEQEQKMYDLFENALIPSYGSNSNRASEGKEYIMPYLADENDQMTVNNTQKIGGTSIPEDLLSEFIRRFVEVDKAIVKIGEEEIKDTFDYEQFNELVSKLSLQISLEKGDYFNYGEHYYVNFKYGSKEQEQKMYDLFENALIPSYGSNSSRASEGKEYIMPYLADENDQMTVNNTQKIGGTSIPEDLLPEFIRRFVEVDKAIVKIGEEEIKDTFDYKQFEELISSISMHK